LSGIGKIAASGFFGEDHFLQPGQESGAIVSPDAELTEMDVNIDESGAADGIPVILTIPVKSWIVGLHRGDDAIIPGDHVIREQVCFLRADGVEKISS